MKILKKILISSLFITLLPLASCQNTPTSDSSTLQVSEDSSFTSKESLIGMIKPYIEIESKSIENQVYPVGVKYSLVVGCWNFPSPEWSFDELELLYDDEKMSLEERLNSYHHFYFFKGLKEGDASITFKVRDFIQEFRFTLTPLNKIESKCLYKQIHGPDLENQYLSNAYQTKEFIKKYNLWHVKLPTYDSFYEDKFLFVFLNCEDLQQRYTLFYEYAFLNDSKVYLNYAKMVLDYKFYELDMVLYVIEIDRKYIDYPLEKHYSYEPDYEVTDPVIKLILQQNPSLLL